MDHKKPAKLSIERDTAGYFIGAAGSLPDLCLLFGILGAYLVQKGVPNDKLMRVVDLAVNLGMADNALTVDAAALPHRDHEKGGERYV